MRHTFPTPSLHIFSSAMQLSITTFPALSFTSSPRLSRLGQRPRSRQRSHTGTVVASTLPSDEKMVPLRASSVRNISSRARAFSRHMSPFTTCVLMAHISMPPPASTTSTRYSTSILVNKALLCFFSSNFYFVFCCQGVTLLLLFAAVVNPDICPCLWRQVHRADRR